MSNLGYYPRGVRRFLFPDPFFGGLTPASVGITPVKIDDFWTLQPTGYRVPFLFDKPLVLIVSIFSDLGFQRDWKFAGLFAQVLLNDPAGETKQTVKRLYLDSRTIELEYLGFPYYLEFWPVSWLTDYRLEIWAKLQPTPLIFQIQGTPLTIGGEPFTISGVILIL